jgi:D-3-phosphoglycerate dehydrogenase
MTELGIPVFNTPGANANAVKELALCGMFLGSRRIHAGTNHMKDLGRQGLAKERVEKDKSMFGGREIRGKRLSVLGLGQIGTILARDAYALGMDIVGFDPNLSVKSALALPHEIHLVDSIAAAVTNADYISINIPYIKGKGGTHGIINKDIIDNMKPSAVLLNFARGELIDSEAMLSFLDSGTGRYITDFPDDLLWNHKNSIVLPHLGASTVEAEDQAASMAVDTIKDYLETGAIRNSVNFPTTSLPKPEDNSVRVTIVNKNLPGRLAQISESCANLNMNIIQQLNVSRGVIAYNVVDIDRNGQNNIQPFKRLQHKMLELDGVLSCRILFGI